LLHGWSLRQIAEALLISDEAVRNHIQDYETARKLRPESGGSQAKLSSRQSQQLEAHLLQHTYLYVKDIVAYVEVTFGVKYTVQGLRNWLQKHQFSYKKPAVAREKLMRNSKKNGGDLQCILSRI
jgi:transposase